MAQRKMDRALQTLNKGTIPYIEVSEAISKDSLIYLDSRDIKEFRVSHLKDAIWVGHDFFDPKRLQEIVPDLDTPVVVYCSIGVRSEDIGERLKELGYTNIQNLYGGIFKWKNSGYPVFDPEGNKTEKVHAYNRVWGKLLTKGEKIYE
ncbi:rhodanese-like domain-containing protein [Maribacter polysaccharolyticus]|uniref:rhodanese-like domain-containing protein n=1 Tax=Maribacter polysaccharolyticus TaxID=3020831 RepID=UPI00237F49A8|nr:rhodanese-like domain-containing protein [Maribacter polysaccharolyticus]MDE3742896.1 rhodanese-like domain-containing protein [Maribacter polysaccharolyticus]